MAVIGGGIAGVVMLLLLIFIAFLLFRRPHPQERSLYRKLSLWQPRTPKLPVQPPPTRSISLPIYVSSSSRCSGEVALGSGDMRDAGCV